MSCSWSNLLSKIKQNSGHRVFWGRSGQLRILCVCADLNEAGPSVWKQPWIKGCLGQGPSLAWARKLVEEDQWEETNSNKSEVHSPRDCGIWRILLIFVGGGGLGVEKGNWGSRCQETNKQTNMRNLYLWNIFLKFDFWLGVQQLCFASSAGWLTGRARSAAT